MPPTAALVELKGALRHHGTDAAHLGDILRIRSISRLGVDLRIGVGPTVTVPATASARIAVPGGHGPGDRLRPDRRPGRGPRCRP
ncbi:hypothetical protein AB0F03_37560 [Streptomyces sp. NPDC028722]|uniref:hypothetical protein n=1 Tax=Streptomyces sp. NPDC028722 TaxID=3155016 RepID=UPI0033F50403